ncbi:hypothetical protein [Streptomyces cellulosae]|uniref:AG1 protein n=1 Tax=Streptomyces cellulosae TaxID=1968 RepID=A0ABW7Y5X5_STRCE
MSWDEWEQLKTQAIERQATQMQLNQLPADQGGTSPGSGGASGKVRSDKAAWSKAGKDVSGLRDNISKALTQLQDGQAGLGKDSGCLTATAQRDVYDSWDRYVKDVSGRCEALAGLFERVGTDLLRTDEAIGSEVTLLEIQYDDTPAVGGQAGDR